MDWMQIVSALALLMFVIFLFPRARDAMKNSPKGSTSDWMGFAVPMVAIFLFILLLIELV